MGADVMVVDGGVVVQYVDDVEADDAAGMVGAGDDVLGEAGSGEGAGYEVVVVVDVVMVDEVVVDEVVASDAAVGAHAGEVTNPVVDLDESGVLVDAVD